MSQLELEIARAKEPDRNSAKGGRSFYFFDFDDNVAFLTTAIYIFHKETGAELALSTGEFALVSHDIGIRDAYKDYELNFDDQVGSFRRFRDMQHSFLRRLLTQKEHPFVEDLAQALSGSDLQWKGPSWSCFYHAVFNQRPLAVITARGHHPQTIQRGIDLLVQKQFLPTRPNYLSVYPVSNPLVRQSLGDQQKNWGVADLKKAAIAASVEKAISVYGYNPHHRFGMSDDDPKNLDLISQAMWELKNKYPEMSFFVINTSKNKLVKQEVFIDHVDRKTFDSAQQLDLFQ